MRFYILFLIVAASFSCGDTSSNTNTINANSTRAVVPAYDFQIIKTYPHDPQAFTQGLEFHNGLLYEGTGGKAGDDFYSSLRRVELETGKVQLKQDLSRDFFGEGITILGDRVYQVTWREMTAFVYDIKDFKLLRELRYQGQGWGLTNDGTNLIMSDGTHVIRFFNPEDFRQVRSIVVKDERGSPIMDLNELEMVKGEIWANVWQSGWIMRIDPETGKLLGRVDINKLVEEERSQNPKADVLNGIAYDADGDRMFITGKFWRRLFEIKVSPK